MFWYFHRIRYRDPSSRRGVAEAVVEVEEAPEDPCRRTLQQTISGFFTSFGRFSGFFGGH